MEHQTHHPGAFLSQGTQAVEDSPCGMLALHQLAADLMEALLLLLMKTEGAK